MLGVCGKRCFIELGKNDIDAGVYVREDGVGAVAFKNKDSEHANDFPVELRFINVENVDKFISALNDLKGKMSKR